MVGRLVGQFGAQLVDQSVHLFSRLVFWLVSWSVSQVETGLQFHEKKANLRGSNDTSIRLRFPLHLLFDFCEVGEVQGLAIFLEGMVKKCVLDDLGPGTKLTGYLLMTLIHLLMLWTTKLDHRFGRYDVSK